MAPPGKGDIPSKKTNQSLLEVVYTNFGSVMSSDVNKFPTFDLEITFFLGGMGVLS